MEGGGRLVAPLSEPHRLPELWFEDGNIVLQAENSQFRVYRGVLAARSCVFQDMLGFPQPSDSELVESCPLVHLPDCAGEVTTFLKAIFDSGFFLPYPFPTDFDTIAGTLRLAHKYEVGYLRARALVHLSSMFTFFNSATGPSTIPPSWNRPEEQAYKMCVVQLAREVDALWILPTAFYSLSTSSAALGTEIFHGTVYNGRPATLSELDQQSFLNGNRIQSASVVDHILRFLLFPVDIVGCTQPLCYKRRLQAFEANRQDRQESPYDPLHVWDENDWVLLSDVCTVCLKAMKQIHAEARHKFWDDLPRIYGLPPWPELERMRMAAIGADLEVLT
ncbi:hypothetical protein B0H14DRAFT_3143701 [Mycena olivaceomarginata]|nr:hypothetical protein B0H14DRAFT_3143701 [Mycena olivaceomarginata]